MRWTHASREIDLLENLDIVHITLLVDIYWLIEVSSPPARALQRDRGTAVELGSNHSKLSKDVYLKDKARIWP